jgi:hypothetical protein
MNGYQCWFCGEGIENSDAGAVVITVEGLRRRHAGSRGDDAPCQSVYAHSECAKVRLKGATMDIEPIDFVEED